ncbi:MAG TPA: sulfatase-like hydrolase/transferase [Myxococcota bacterium]|nr:sulfatase-like hydrolase/transferase [Myxococcota bacterium]
MNRLASFFEVLGAALLIGVTLGLVEGLVATPQIGEPLVGRLLGVGLIDVLVLGLIGCLAGVVAALLPRRRAVGTWARVAALLPLVVAGLIAFGVAQNRSTLDAELEGSLTHEQPLPRLVSEDGGAIVLITLDTLRPDALESMPRLAARTASARRYQRAHSNAPWTLPAMASLQTGVSVHEHGAGARVPGQGNHVRAPMDDSLDTLATKLADRGYVSAAIVTNPYLGVRYGFHEGFDRFHDLARRSQLNLALRRTFLLRLVLEPFLDTAAATTELALDQWPQMSAGRSLLWVHYIDAHAPYHADGWVPGTPCELPSCFEDWAAVRKGAEVEDRERVRALYEEDLARLDSAVDALLEEVIADGVLVVLTADHGEEFWDHGGVEHGNGFHEEVVRVPLFVWGAGEGAVDRHVDLVGVHGALLSWADRRDLGPLEPGGPDAMTPMASLLFGEEASACTDGHTKWLAEGRYDLDEDPGEHDLLAPEAVACLPGPLPAYEGELGDDLSVLRSLGYVE